MRLEQFVYLEKLSAEESINNASKKIHMTPQALSQAIKSLEDELGMSLIKRSHHGITLTEEGERVIEAARQFQMALEGIKGSSVKQYLAISGEFSILAQNGVQFFLPNLIAELYKHTKEVSIVLNEGRYIEVVNAVLEQEREIVLLAMILVDGEKIYEFDEEKLFFQPLTEYKWCCQVNKDSPLAAYKTISIGTLLEYPIIVFGDDNPYSNLTVIRCFGEPEKIIFVQHNQIRDKMIAGGVGIGFGIYNANKEVPKSLDNEIVNIKLNDDLRMSYGYVVGKNKDFSEETAAFIDFMEQNRLDWQ